MSWSEGEAEGYGPGETEAGRPVGTERTGLEKEEEEDKGRRVGEKRQVMDEYPEDGEDPNRRGQNRSGSGTEPKERPEVHPRTEDRGPSEPTEGSG